MVAAGSRAAGVHRGVRHHLKVLPLSTELPCLGAAAVQLSTPPPRPPWPHAAPLASDGVPRVPMDLDIGSTGSSKNDYCFPFATVEHLP